MEKTIMTALCVIVNAKIKVFQDNYTFFFLGISKNHKTFFVNKK